MLAGGALMVASFVAMMAFLVVAAKELAPEDDPQEPRVCPSCNSAGMIQIDEPAAGTSSEARVLPEASLGTAQPAVPGTAPQEVVCTRCGYVGKPNSVGVTGTNWAIGVAILSFLLLLPSLAFLTASTNGNTYVGRHFGSWGCLPLLLCFVIGLVSIVRAIVKSHENALLGPRGFCGFCFEPSVIPTDSPLGLRYNYVKGRTRVAIGLGYNYGATMILNFTGGASDPSQVGYEGDFTLQRHGPILRGALTF